MGLNETSRFQRCYLSRWPPLTYKSQEIDRNELSLALDYSANYITLQDEMRGGSCVESVGKKFLIFELNVG